MDFILFSQCSESFLMLRINITCASVAIKLAPKDLYPFFVPVDFDQRFVFNKNVGYFLSKYGYIEFLTLVLPQARKGTSLDTSEVLQRCVNGCSHVWGRLNHSMRLR